jgi:hypothetical protein
LLPLVKLACSPHLPPAKDYFFSIRGSFLEYFAPMRGYGGTSGSEVNSSVGMKFLILDPEEQDVRPLRVLPNWQAAIKH